MRLGKFSRTIGRSQQELSSHSFVRGAMPEQSLDINSDFSGGINVEVEATKIADNEMAFCENFVYINKTLRPRPAYSFVTNLFTTKIHAIIIFDPRGVANPRKFAFTKNAVIDFTNLSAPFELTGPPLSGTDNERIFTFVVEGELYFHNSGGDGLFKIDTVANTYAKVGNSDNYKYFAVIANRIIGANFSSDLLPNPNRIGGSGDRNYEEWDPNVDISSFVGNLIEPRESPARLGDDDITGLLNLNNILLVTRSKSLWVGIPQPVATTPLIFLKKVSGIGCNAPYTLKSVRGGAMWYDPELNNIFFYDAKGEDVIAVGNKIIGQLQPVVGDVTEMFANYDEVEDVYEIYVENIFGGYNTTKIFKFYRKLNAWLVETTARVSCASTSILQEFSPTIDGTSTIIDSALGTLDSSTSWFFTHSRLFGRSDGRIVFLTATNADLAADGSTLTGISSLLYTKAFSLPGRKQLIQAFGVQCKANSGSPFIVTSYRTTHDFDHIGFIESLQWGTGLLWTGVGVGYAIRRRAVLGQIFQFAVTLIAGDPTVELREYFVRRVPAGEL